MANNRNSVALTRIVDQIVTNLMRKYPGVNFDQSLREKITDYIDGQTKAKHELIDRNVVPATRMPNDPNGLDMLYDAFHNRYIEMLDTAGNIIKIDLQVEIFLALREQLLSSITTAERSLVGSKMCYEVESGNGSYNKGAKPLDFSDPERCAHMLGLPYDDREFKKLYRHFEKYCKHKGIDIEVRFPSTTVVDTELKKLKKEVKDFFNNVVPNISSLKQFNGEATKLTVIIKDFYDKNKDQLTEKEAKELSEIMTLVSTNFKNMERLYYNDMEELLDYFYSPDFALQINELFENENVYMLVNNNPTPIDITNYIGNNEKLFEIIHLLCDEEGNLLFPMLNRTKIHPNIISSLAAFDPQDVFEKADKVFNNSTLDDLVISYYEEKDPLKKEALLNNIKETSNELKYISKNNIDGLLNSIKDIKKMHSSYEDPAVNIYLDSLSDYLSNRKNNTETKKYDSKEFYINKRFKIDMLKVVMQEYHGDFDNFNMNLFYNNNVDKFPFFIQIPQLPKLKTFKEMYDSFPFKSQCDILIHNTDSTSITNQASTTLANIQRYFENRELDIEDYIFYQKLKKMIDTNLNKVLGNQASIYNSNYTSIESLFNQGYSLSSCTSMLDIRREEIDGKISLHGIQNNTSYDPLLVFKFMCEHDNGKTFAKFLRSQNLYTFNFAKIVSKRPLFDSIVGITHANVEFNIGDDRSKVNTTYITRGMAQLEMETNTYKARSLRSTSGSTPKARVVYFRNEKAIRAMKRLALDKNPMYIAGQTTVTIPSDYQRASRVA